MAVKYVKDFEFPSGFGFSGSASDRSTVPVRGYERAKPQRFAEGGEVQKPKPAPPPPPPPPPKAPEKASLADIMSGKTRRQQEKDLGLKKGGKVNRGREMMRKRMGDECKVKKAMGGPVKAAKGGDIAQDKKLIKSALDKHIRAPKPRGHGVK